MNVIAPIAELKELEPLVRAGAGELYCGVTPWSWIHRYGTAVWSNRREPLGANILDLRGLAALAGEARRQGLPLHVALNAPCHTEEELPLVLDIARAAVEEAGVDSLILADPGLMIVLRERHPGIGFTLSSVAAARSVEAIGFFRDLGARRVVFPRHLTLAEMARLVAASPEIEHEAFVLNDGCAFEEGLCRSHHGVPGLTALCVHRWEVRATRSDGRSAGPEEESLWEDVLASRGEWLRRIHGAAPLNAGGMPDGACGLCAIPELARIGIAGLKVAGRQAGTFRKVLGVQLVRSVLDRAEAGEEPRSVREAAIALRKDPEGCRSHLGCSYRDAP
jgi:putative protease